MMYMHDIVIENLSLILFLIFLLTLFLLCQDFWTVVIVAWFTVFGINLILVQSCSPEITKLININIRQLNYVLKYIGLYMFMKMSVQITTLNTIIGLGR